ncbi:hypothetical protein I302_105270 [Kwoniella bestiolae CBS 10118]|uniref:Phytanoyl-CoA dioxygenase n=1 Tax=Kwoniella bestiolae CBS 10118 TaxID=1296100 RepID=A0A1B9FSM6_9TREE|nr:phytanoyl-CoA dioxygenase [Kwoniella bestiolae CBS 10118]OCF21779.1 phytanoyl-CoA dioxygenase [Kwoniella bestiolae CBS 10118]
MRVQTRARLQQAFTEEDLQLFSQTCSRTTDPSDYPLSIGISKNVVVYSGDDLRQKSRANNQSRGDVMDELHRCLGSGPGVFIVKGFERNMDVIERTNQVFKTIIEREKEHAKGDHFAAAGTNDRIWNSFQKHAVEDPESFVKYYANDLLALVSEAWLGPGYQVTAQTNIVKPGGQPQKPHRDYHLGFQSESTASKFPIPTQIASAMLTLQGAVAHSPMPLDSGPTQLLPYSQQFEHGYLAYRHPEFVDFFHNHMVQSELEVGDAIFFNPALFHAAGENRTTNLHRIGNLLQISACWSKPMESVDYPTLLRSTWSHVLQYTSQLEGGVDHPLARALLQAISDGYSFPTNLDKDPPPADSHCPETQYDRITVGVKERWSMDTLQQNIKQLQDKRAA